MWYPLYLYHIYSDVWVEPLETSNSLIVERLFQAPNGQINIGMVMEQLRRAHRTKDDNMRRTKVGPQNPGGLLSHAPRALMP
jgi:hypothetical protein